MAEISYENASVSKESNQIQEIVRVYRNPKIEAFKAFFEYIQANYPDDKFARSSMPGVNKKYLKEVKQKTKGTFQIDGSPEIVVAKAILLYMCKNGILELEEEVINVYGDESISFVVSKKGKNQKLNLANTILIGSVQNCV